eukprot:CAMPEP_0175739730 /NCGR_PEP_ID=MMETSP0097-20121207/55148_1 /TAXON_ID=311494 /ORGANISM="Alexandrium monilatum, Strain CCMP3105" /LENGTH=103 /DNA_ID=CAMNT_0017047989 /DNA_START=185 /DNA_END=494 /DNA_ORIENTATION=+
MATAAKSSVVCSGQVDFAPLRVLTACLVPAFCQHSLGVASTPSGFPTAVKRWYSPSVLSKWKPPASTLLLCSRRDRKRWMPSRLFDVTKGWDGGGDSPEDLKG